MNSINELYSAPRSSLKRKLSRKRPETKATAQTDEPQEAPKVLGPYENKDKCFPMVTCPAGRLGSGIRTTEGLM